MSVTKDERLREADVAIDAAAAERPGGRLSPPGAGPATATAALLKRRSIRAFTDIELESSLVVGIARRAIKGSDRVIPEIDLDILVLLRRGEHFAEATLVEVGGQVSALPWAAMPVRGVGRPMPQEDFCQAGGLLVVCGRRGTFPDDWGDYRLLLVKAGYVATACGVETTAAGVAGCLVSGIVRASFRASLGGAAARHYPMMIVAVGTET